MIVTETGRQPVDNPDTHLELTMIHEGPLLEYAGPRPRLPAVGRGRPPLGRAGARRASSSSRTAAPFACALALLAVGSRSLCVALAAVETRARPSCGSCACRRCSALGALIALAGVGSVARGGGRVSGALVTLVLALGLGVVVVRRRSLAIALVAAQSLALGLGGARADAERSSEFLVAGARAGGQGAVARPRC